MIAGVEQLLEQPVSAPFAATNKILAEAEAAGKMTQVDALCAGHAPDEARIAGHAVTVARMALAIDELVLERDALSKALERAAAILARYPKHDEAWAEARAALARVQGGA